MFSPEWCQLHTVFDRESGALGSRLTGAGWGGCAVSMVPTKEVMNFLVKVKKNFYEKEPSRVGKVGTALFATQPGSGALIYLPTTASGWGPCRPAKYCVIWCHRVIDGYMYMVKRNNVHPMWYYYLKWCCISTDCLNLVYKSGICLIKIVLLIKLS